MSYSSRHNSQIYFYNKNDIDKRNKIVNILNSYKQQFINIRNEEKPKKNNKIDLPSIIKNKSQSYKKIIRTKIDNNLIRRRTQNTYNIINKYNNNNLNNKENIKNNISKQGINKELKECRNKTYNSFDYKKIKKNNKINLKYLYRNIIGYNNDKNNMIYGYSFQKKRYIHRNNKNKDIYDLITNTYNSFLPHKSTNNLNFQ